METNQIPDQPLTPQTVEKKRPTLVTILCILFFIGLILGFIGLLILLFLQDIPELPVAFRELPFGYLIYSMVMSVFYLAALVYIWKMKKMGLSALTGLFAVDLVISFAIAPSFVLGESLVVIIIYIVVIGLFWTQHKKMS